VQRHSQQWPLTDCLQLHAFLSYLNPKGLRESQLLKTFKAWLPELEGGMKRRRIAMGLEVPLEEEGRRVRMSRKAAGDEPEGYMNWKVSRGGLEFE
jgi:bromodomain adjacent to zinc finger domain protein 1A